MINQKKNKQRNEIINTINIYEIIFIFALFQY